MQTTTTTTTTTKFTVVSVEMGNYSAHVYAKRGKLEVTVRFETVDPSVQPSASNPFAYVDTRNKLSGNKTEDITGAQTFICQKALAKQMKAKARSLRNWEKSIGHKA